MSEEPAKPIKLDLKEDTAWAEPVMTKGLRVCDSEVLFSTFYVVLVWVFPTI